MKPSDHACRDAIIKLLAQSEGIVKTARMAQLSARPVDMTAVLTDILALQSRTLALLLDEVLVMNGRNRTIQFKEKPKEKDNGQGESPIQVIGN